MSRDDSKASVCMTMGDFAPEELRERLQQVEAKERRVRDDVGAAKRRAEEYKRKQLQYCRDEVEREILQNPDVYPSLFEKLRLRIARDMKRDFRRGVRV